MKGYDRISKTNAQDRLIGEQLESYTFSDKYKGKPLKIRQRNFSVSIERQVMAAMGVPEHIKRAKVIEDKIRNIKKDLKRKYENLTLSMGSNHEEFNRIWKLILQEYDFMSVNKLIVKHNLLFPKEANLRMDPETGEYMYGSTVWKEMPMIHAEDILKELPYR